MGRPSLSPAPGETLSVLEEPGSLLCRADDHAQSRRPGDPFAVAGGAVGDGARCGLSEGLSSGASGPDPHGGQQARLGVALPPLPLHPLLPRSPSPSSCSPEEPGDFLLLGGYTCCS